MCLDKKGGAGKGGGGGRRAEGEECFLLLKGRLNILLLAFSTFSNSRSSPRAVLDFYFRSRAERKEGGGDEEGNKGKEGKRGREVDYYHPSPFFWEPTLLPLFQAPLFPSLFLLFSPFL